MNITSCRSWIRNQREADNINGTTVRAVEYLEEAMVELENYRRGQAAVAARAGVAQSAVNYLQLASQHLLTAHGDACVTSREYLASAKQRCAEFAAALEGN